MSIQNKLSFRLIAPIVAVTVLLWGFLYVFVARTIKEFAHDRAREDLTSISREILNTLNMSFDVLIQSGRINDPKEILIRKALALETLEEVLQKFKLLGVVYEGERPNQKAIMRTVDSSEAGTNPGENTKSHRLFTVQSGGKPYFAYGLDFQPWRWKIVLFRETAAYAGPAATIRQLYWMTGILLLGMALGLVILENRLLRRPVDGIIQDLHRGTAPKYRGVEEFEYLSRSIAGMMQTLAEREERLQESETRYRTIFETTGTAIAIGELDTTLSLVNTKFLEYSGYSKEEIEGKMTWTQIVAKEDVERVREVNQLRLTRPEEAPRQYEFTMVDKGRNLRHVLLTADIFPGTTQTIASLIDITDRKREELERRLIQEARAAKELRKKNVELGREIDKRKETERSLRASEERFRAVVETTEDYIFIKNTELEYTHVNPAYIKLLDRPPDVIIGADDHALSIDSHYAAHAKRLETRVLQGETLETEHTLMWKGSPLSLNINRFPLRASSGEIFAVCGVARDVSDRTSLQPVLAVEPPHAYISSAIQETIKRVALSAQSESTVLFLGESGAGKDYWARYLHDQSNRAGGPFFEINCAALSPELVESELFGHTAGAFTGARGRKRGLLELAEGGTLLLNEIGEMPMPIQAKLLTFLDTQTITRVGAEKSITVDTRILAATNRDLAGEVDKGRFRQDLYYRLAVLTITTPPLRDRIEDLSILVEDLLHGLSEKLGLPGPSSIDSEALDRLLAYQWPGNVRELRNVLERALILRRGERIRAEDLALNESCTGGSPSFPTAELQTLLSRGGSFQEIVNETKRLLITNALKHSSGSIKDAAVFLGMKRNSIDYHIRSLGLRE